jgi:enoyl-CoA hydratase
MLATVDGITRRNPEGLWFRRHAQVGASGAVEWRGCRRVPRATRLALIADLERRLAEAHAAR